MEEKIKQDLHQYLQSQGKVDERLPECTDIEDKWQSIAEAYLPDGIREFNAYPTVEDVLHMKGKGLEELNNLVAECASRTNSNLHHAHLEPGTPEAFKAYVACLHQLYLMGAAVQLKRMGYHMTLMN